MSVSDSGNHDDVSLSEKLEQLRCNVRGHWSTRAEATLLSAMEQLHTRLMTRSTNTLQKVEELNVRTSAAHVSLANAFNSLKLLSQQQFVQHRIATEDLQVLRERQRELEEGSESDKSEGEPSTSSAASLTPISGYQLPATKQAIVQRMHAYMEERRAALAEEGVQIPLCPEDVEELAEENPYHRRRLCALIGTNAFLRGADIGCIDKNSSREVRGQTRPAASPAAPTAAAAATASPAASLPSAVAPLASQAVAAKAAVATAPSQGIHKIVAPGTAAAAPAQGAGRPAASVVPPPVKSVVPPPKPAVPPPAKATAVQRVAAKKKQRQALFSSSSSSASSASPTVSPPPPPREVQKRVEEKTKAKKALAKRAGRNLFGSSSSGSSENESETPSSDSSTLSSTTSEDSPPVAPKPKPGGKASAVSAPPPPPPPPPPPTAAAKPSFASSPAQPLPSPSASAPTPATPASTVALTPPPPPLRPPPLTDSVAHSSPTGVPLTASTPPQPTAPSALPPPPLVFSFDDAPAPMASPRSLLPPPPPALATAPTVLSTVSAEPPVRRGKLLSTSSDEDN